MNITYSTQAKDDLARIDWRVRGKIINTIRELKQIEDKPLKKMHESNLHKLDAQTHLVIGAVNNKDFSVLSVVKKKRIKFPE